MSVYLNLSLTFVIAAGLPSSNFLFIRIGFRLPPVARRLCQLSWEIPVDQVSYLDMVRNLIKRT